MSRTRRQHNEDGAGETMVTPIVITPRASTSGWTIGIGVVASLAVGAALGYAWYERKQLVALTKTIGEALPPGVRLPRPDFAVHLPIDTEDYLLLDQVVCDCVSRVGPMADIDEHVAAAQMCAARELYPDFAWPPITGLTGDHPSVQTLWTILGYQAARALTMQICPATPPTAMARRVVTNPRPYRRHAR
jgi:hypothetical protein